jgi:hypothetical protein
MTSSWSRGVDTWCGKHTRFALVAGDDALGVVLEPALSR